MKTAFAIAIALVLATTAVAQPPASMTKAQIHVEMNALAQSKAPADVARYELLSAFTGGDRPGQSNGGVNGGPTLSGLTVPPNCAGTTDNFSQAAPVAIADVAVSTSTLSVTTANTFLWSVSVTANISHTFAADMDITLTSPGGTIVTLSTDNGAGNDNVFAGTTWDDYATTTTTDAIYANLVVQTDLVPEEAMWAFRGEDPNGTWTLTVSDDLAGDVGTINSWSLSIVTVASAPINTTTTVANNTPTPINDVVANSSTINFSGLTDPVCEVRMTANLTHTFAADMDISLASPDFGTSTVSTDNGAGNDDVFAGTNWFDDANPAGALPYTTNNGVTTDQVYANLTVATPLVPEGAFGRFVGSAGNGTWTLNVNDDLAGDTGTINSWSLDLVTCACVIPDADVALTKSVAPTEVAPGGQAVFTLTATNNGPGNATNVVVTDTLPAGLVYVSNDCGAAFASPTVTWTIGNLANAASVVCNVTVTVNASGTNNATISSDQNDPVPANNASAATVLGDQNVLEVPTAGTFGLLALALGLGFAAFTVLRRRS
jgi:uncharacterized repeat protein (TIGR01451 family)